MPKKKRRGAKLSNSTSWGAIGAKNPCLFKLIIVLMRGPFFYYCRFPYPKQIYLSFLCLELKRTKQTTIFSNNKLKIDIQQHISHS